MDKENLSDNKKEGGVEPIVFFGPVERTIMALGGRILFDFEDKNGNCINEEVYRPCAIKLLGGSQTPEKGNNLNGINIITEECNNIKTNEGGLIKQPNPYMEPRDDIPIFDSRTNINGIITIPGDINENKNIEKINALSIANDFVRSENVHTIGDKDIYVYNNRFYEKVSEMTLKRKIMKRYEHKLKANGCTYTVNEIFNAILMNPYINQRELIPDSERVSFENCVLNIRTGREEIHSPNNFITYGINGNYLGHYTYHTPVFDKFMYDITGGDEQLILRILQMIGYILTPDTSAKVFFVLQGVPDSGKSVLTNLISNLISEEAVTTLDIHSYGERFSISELYGKALAISPDLPALSLDSKAVGKIKQITGNDKISTDVKFSSILKFKCSTKIIVATNHPLILKQRDDAFLRRAIVIPFRYPVADSNRDPYLLDNILFEKDFIISKSINAYLDLVNNGYKFAGYYRLNECVMYDSVGDEDVMGSIYNFVSNHFEPQGDSIVYVSDAYEKYKYEGGMCSENVFSQYFREICEDKFGAEKTRKRKNPKDNAQSALRGIAWKNI